MQKLLFLSILAGMLSFYSCSKDSSSSSTTTPTTNSFKWTENGGAEITADSAKWVTWSTGTGLRAWKGGMTQFFEINWTSNTSIGTKTLDAAGGFTYLKNSKYYINEVSHNLEITAFADNKLTGKITNIVAKKDLNDTLLINVTFTNIPKYF